MQSRQAKRCYAIRHSMSDAIHRWWGFPMLCASLVSGVLRGENNIQPCTVSVVFSCSQVASGMGRVGTNDKNPQLSPFRTCATCKGPERTKPPYMAIENATQTNHLCAHLNEITGCLGRLRISGETFYQPFTVSQSIRVLSATFYGSSWLTFQLVPSPPLFPTFSASMEAPHDSMPCLGFQRCNWDTEI